MNATGSSLRAVPRLGAILGALVLAVVGPARRAHAEEDDAARCSRSALAERACAGLEATARGDWVEAEATLESVLLVADDAVLAMRDAIERALEQARAHLGSIDARCSAPGATLALDDVDRGLAPLERPLRASVGDHRVSCRADDHEPASAEVHVEAGSLAQVELTPAPIDRRPILERASGGQRVLGVVVLSLGGASLGVGFGTLGAGLDASPGPEREQLLDVARGTLIAGGVALVAGIVLTLTAP